MSQRNSASEGVAQALLLGLFTQMKMLTPHEATSGLSVNLLSHPKDLPLNAQKFIVCFFKKYCSPLPIKERLFGAAHLPGTVLLVVLPAP